MEFVSRLSDFRKAGVKDNLFEKKYWLRTDRLKVGFSRCFFMHPVPRVSPLLRLPGTRTLVLNSSPSSFSTKRAILLGTLVINAGKNMYLRQNSSFSILGKA